MHQPLLPAGVMVRMRICNVLYSTGVTGTHWVCPVPLVMSVQVVASEYFLSTSKFVTGPEPIHDHVGSRSHLPATQHMYSGKVLQVGSALLVCVVYGPLTLDHCNELV